MIPAVLMVFTCHLDHTPPDHGRIHIVRAGEDHDYAMTPASVERLRRVLKRPGQGIRELGASFEQWSLFDGRRDA